MHDDLKIFLKLYDNYENKKKKFNYTRRNYKISHVKLKHQIKVKYRKKKPNLICIFHLFI